MDVAGARVLITHSIISRIMGSTVVALEVAEYLKAHGADVLVYSPFTAGAALRLFSDRGIPTVTGDDPKLSPSDFDLVWVHSQVLPLSFVRELDDPGKVPWPAFVFNHMSSLDEASDEFAWMLGLEELLSSLSLFVSPAAREANEAYFRQPPPLALFENPAPSGFCSLDHRPGPAPQRVLVVSNHIPAELNQACDQLASQGIEVVRTGEGSSLYTLVTPELISQFDVVVTIGKTVQYCLVAGVPVYVYDHFGGPGYLDSENFDALAWRHFSARDCSPLSPDEIAQGVLAGYAAAVEFQQRHRRDFIERFALDGALPRVLAEVQPRQLGRVDPPVLAAYLATQRFSSRFYARWGLCDELQDRVSVLSDQVQVALDERDHARGEAAELRSSWSFRIGFALTRPVALLGAIIARLRRRQGWSGRSVA